MDKIWMLAMANIRKRKSQAISLMIFVLIAACFMNTGLVLYFDFGKFFEERAEQLNAPHLSIIQDERFTAGEQLDWLNGRTGVTKTEMYPVACAQTEYYSNGLKTVCVSVISDITAKQTMNPPTLIGEHLPLDNGLVYLPYIMKASGGYNLGDDFLLIISGNGHKFNVAGFTEEIPFGDSMNQMYRFYINSADLEKLRNEYPPLRCDMISVRLDAPDYSLKLREEYVQQFIFSADENATPVFIHTRSYDGIVGARTFIPGIVAMVLTALALILLMVSLIVMRFGIINNIEESMVNIGVMKAAGYRNNQIIASMLLQFGGLAFIGGGVGIAASMLIMPPIAELLETMSALIWEPLFNSGFALMTLCVTVSAVLFVSFSAAKKIYKLHPLTALRGGILTHNFRKNNFPLDKSRGSLSFMLAMKKLVRSKGQSVMIAIIIAAVSFASTIGIAVYYNVGMKTLEFMSFLSGMTNDVVFILKDADDTNGLTERLLERQDVAKARAYQDIFLTTDGGSVTTFVSEDFAHLGENALLEGRYPKHKNEIGIAGGFLKTTGKNIGDTITIRQGNTEREFLITGLIQTLENDGVTLFITYDGLLTLQDEYKFNQIYVYLEPRTDAAAFIEDVKSSEGDIFSGMIDIKEMIDAQFGNMGGIFAAVAAGILSVTAIVVILTLYLVIKTMIIRSKREFGIQKAVGFTTIQIMNQISLSFTPVIFTGVTAGGIAGVLWLNPMFTMLMSGLGIVKTNFTIPIAGTLITCAALIMLAYLVSMLIAWRIRKISAYLLINE